MEIRNSDNRRAPSSRHHHSGWLAQALGALGTRPVPGHESLSAFADPDPLAARIAPFLAALRRLVTEDLDTQALIEETCRLAVERSGFLSASVSLPRTSEQGDASTCAAIFDDASTSSSRSRGARLVVPLRAGWKDVGTLELFDASPAVWGSGTAEALERVGFLLGCALELCRERTRRKNAEQELSAGREALEDARQRLRHAHRQAGVAPLAAVVAHDFNNLLGIIVGYTDSVRRSLPVDDTRLRKLDQVLSAASRAVELARQLHTASRPVSPERKPLDVGRLASETAGLLSKTSGAGVELELNLAPDLGAVQADPTQIRQVLVDLATNARAAMKGSGRLTIETSRTTVAAGGGAASENSVPEGAYLLLSVRDTGAGMDEVTKSRVFEPFFTTKAADEGAGLGLTAARDVVEESGGHIRVESTPAHGTVVNIYLPFATGADVRRGVLEAGAAFLPRPAASPATDATQRRAWAPQSEARAAIG